MENNQYIRPTVRVVDVHSAALMDDGYSEDPNNTPEVSDTELDSNRWLFDQEQTPTSRRHNVWE